MPPRTGKKNKVNAEVQAKLEAMDCDPIEGMVRIAQQAEQEAATAWKALPELLQQGYEHQDDMEDFAAWVQRTLKGQLTTRLAHYDLAGKMYKELAQYIASKRKAIEVEAGGVEPLGLMTAEQVLAMAKAMAYSGVTTGAADGECGN